MTRRPLCALLIVFLSLRFWQMDGGPATVAWSPTKKASASFIVTTHRRASCGRGELYQSHWRRFPMSWRAPLTKSEVKQAMWDSIKACAKMSRCTVFTLDTSTSQVRFCSVYYNDGPDFDETWLTVAYEHCPPNATRYSMLEDAGIRLHRPPLASGMQARCVVSTPLDTVPTSLAERYIMHHETRANCRGNKLLTFPMVSLSQALLYCAANPPCTVVSWHKSTATTRMCSTQDIWGPHDVRLEQAAASWTTAVARHGDGGSMNPQPQVPTCGKCAPRLFLVCAPPCPAPDQTVNLPAVYRCALFLLLSRLWGAEWSIAMSATSVNMAYALFSMAI